MLFEHWDPIGVNTGDDTDPKDEYSSYVPQLIGMVMHAATDAGVAELLGNLESHHMGLSASPIAKRLDIAARIRAVMFGADGVRPNG